MIVKGVKRCKFIESEYTNTNGLRGISISVYQSQTYSSGVCNGQGCIKGK